jgi:lycopene beta-cyclase
MALPGGGLVIGEKSMTQYDFIIAGGGLAGLSLACHLVRSPLRRRSILIVDRSAKEQNDRTFSFWSERPSLFDMAIHRSWDRLHCAGDTFEQTMSLHSYRYHTVRGLDFYRLARQTLAAQETVTFHQGEITHLEDSVDGAGVRVDGQSYRGRWLFDSTYQGPKSLDDTGYQALTLHFKGWEVETAVPVFDPHTPTLMDFRTPQAGDTRFFYLLPFSERRALVEFTCFGGGRLDEATYTQALKAYLESVRGVRHYEIVAQEGGQIAISDRPYARRLGRHIMAIGARGGRVKPSTGYAFGRIQQDSAAIVQSLLETGAPFAVPADSVRYHFLDSLLLQVMASSAAGDGRGDRMAAIFAALFRGNPIGRIFRFLDETASAWEIVRLMATVPPWPFLHVLFRFQTLKTLAATMQSCQEPLPDGRVSSIPLRRGHECVF